jgi:hypothetical protein
MEHARVFEFVLNVLQLTLPFDQSRSRIVELTLYVECCAFRGDSDLEGFLNPLFPLRYVGLNGLRRRSLHQQWFEYRVQRSIERDRRSIRPRGLCRSVMFIPGKNQTCHGQFAQSDGFRGFEAFLSQVRLSCLSVPSMRADTD